MQMAYDAPGAPEAIGGVRQGLNEVLPGRRFGLAGQGFDQRAGFIEQTGNCRRDVFRGDNVEARCAGEVEQGIVHVDDPKVVPLLCRKHCLGGAGLKPDRCCPNTPVSGVSFFRR